MFNCDKTTDFHDERLRNDLNSIILAVLQINIPADLGQLKGQLIGLRGRVDSMLAFVQSLRGKGTEADDGPIIEYKPHYETRNAARVVQRGGGR